jgi:hypothetical protein
MVEAMRQDSKSSEQNQEQYNRFSDYKQVNRVNSHPGVQLKVQLNAATTIKRKTQWKPTKLDYHALEATTNRLKGLSRPPNLPRTASACQSPRGWPGRRVEQDTITTLGATIIFKITTITLTTTSAASTRIPIIHMIPFLTKHHGRDLNPVATGNQSITIATSQSLATANSQHMLSIGYPKHAP